MLDLCSKQFELLTRTINDFESNMVKRLDIKTVNPPATPAVDELLKKLTMQISSLEGKIDNQSSKIADMKNDFAMILQDIKALREQLQKLATSTASITEERIHHINQNSCNIEDTINNSPVMVSLRDVQLTNNRLCSTNLHSSQRNFALSRKSSPINCASVPIRGGSGYYQNLKEGSIRAEGTELIVTGIVDCLRVEIDPTEVCSCGPQHCATFS